MHFRLSVTKENTVCFPLHRHDCWELMCYIRGSGELLTPESPYSFQENTVMAIPPGLLHGSRSQMPFVNICIHADIAMPEQRIYRLPNGKALRGLFETVRYFDSLGHMPEEALTHLILALRELILPQAEKDPSPEEALFEILAGQFSDPSFSLEQAAKQIGYSADHLRHRFKTRYGVTPAQYRISRRITYAKTLMQVYRDSLKIHELAAMCGYRDPLYFSRQFKKETGVSPETYIQKEKL